MEVLKANNKWIILLCISISLIIAFFFLFRNEKQLNSQVYSFEIKELDSLFALSDTLENMSKEEHIKRNNRILEIATEIRNDTMLAKAYAKKARYYGNMTEMDSMIYNANKSLLYAQAANNDRLEAHAKVILGNYYCWKSDYSQAVSLFLSSIGYFEKIHDSNGISLASNGLGIVYFELNDYDKALVYYQKALSAFEESKNLKGVAVLSMNIANIYTETEKYEEAGNYYDIALELFEKQKDSIMVAGTIMNLASIKEMTMEYGEALDLLNKAYELSDKIKDDFLKIKIFQNRGKIFMLQGDLMKAEQAAQNCMIFSDHLKYPSGIRDAYLLLSEIEKKRNNASRFIDYHQKYYALKDSLSGADVKEKIAYLQHSNELQKNEYEKKLLSSKYEYEKQKNRTISIIFFFIFLAVVFLVASVYLLYRNKNKSLKISELKNSQLIERMKAEKELTELKAQQHQMAIDAKNREITAIGIQLISKNTVLQELSGVVDKAVQNKKIDLTLVQDLEKIIRQNKSSEKDWMQFKDVFVKIHPGFFDLIQEKYPQLSKTEIRICAYLRIRMNTNEIATLLSISPDSLNKARYRIRKKLYLSSEQNLDDFIVGL